MKKIMLLTTGGTIACTYTNEGLKPVKSGNELLSMLPVLPNDISIKVKEVCNIDSTDMTKELWLLLAATIRDNYDKFDGFVITHGTDTLSYSAAALYCLIVNSSKPIILTGSQVPITAKNSDAVANLTNAIRCALDDSFAGVNVVFANRVISGSCAKKIHTTDTDAFVSVNKQDVATINTDGSFMKNLICYSRNNSQLKFYDKLSDDIAVATLTPGITIETIKPLLDKKKCLLLESFGVGGIPYSLYRDLEILFSTEEYSDKFLLIGTQVLNGSTNVNTYETGQRLRDKIPFIETGSMTLEMSYVKMMWALAYADNFEEINKLFAKSKTPLQATRHQA